MKELTLMERAAILIAIALVLLGVSQVKAAEYEQAAQACIHNVVALTSYRSTVALTIGPAQLLIMPSSRN